MFNTESFARETARRFLFWATFHGGDLEQPYRVDFDIEEHGHGCYTRYLGDEPVNLLRYERWTEPAEPRSAVRSRGAVLRAPSPPFAGTWRPSELPERNALLGSDYGEPVGYPEACQIAQFLGYEPWILAEPTLAV